MSLHSPYPDPKPSSNLLVTVGNSPIPVLLTLLGLRPARIAAVVSEQSADVWERVLVAYQHILREQPVVSLTIVKDPLDPKECAEKISHAVNGWDEWEVGYTGGTTAMSVTALRTWMDSAASDIEMPVPGAWYVAEQGDELVRHDGLFMERRDVLEGLSIGLRDIAELHGCQIEGEHDSWMPMRADSSADDVVEEVRAIRASATPSERNALEKDVNHVVGQALARLLDGTATQLYRPVSIRDPDSGLTARLPYSAVTGLTVRLIEPLNYVRPGAASPTITLNRSVGSSKEDLFDLHHHAMTVGGIHAGACVIHLGEDDGSSQSARRIAQIRSDTGPSLRPDDLLGPGEVAREPQPQLWVFSREDLIAALTGEELHPDCDLFSWMTEV